MEWINRSDASGLFFRSKLHTDRKYDRIDDIGDINDDIDGHAGGLVR